MSDFYEQLLKKQECHKVLIFTRNITFKKSNLDDESVKIRKCVDKKTYEEFKSMIGNNDKLCILNMNSNRATQICSKEEFKKVKYIEI